MRPLLLRRILVVAGLAASIVVLGSPAAEAHPLGNFTINVYGGLRVLPDRLLVDYVVDMAEIPAFQARQRIDADADGTVGAAEAEAYRSSECPRLAGGLRVVVDDDPLGLRVGGSELTFPPGVGGLATLRLTCALEAELSAEASERHIVLEDLNYERRIGWREVTAVGDGTTIVSADVGDESVSARLTSYPEEMLGAPLAQRGADLRVEPGDRSGAVGAGGAEAGRVAAGGGGLTAAFESLIGRQDLSLPVGALVIGFAFLVGALHALGPGHGKTIMAAYLAGAGGRVRQAVAVGTAVSAMHTASVVALGLLVLSAQRLLPPERIYPWLTLASGLVALVLGGGLLVLRSNGRGHTHPEGGAEHRHAPAASRRGVAALAVSGGILPSPTAVVVLLASVALHRVALGLAVILAFSLGLAASLTAVGVLAIRARDALSPRLGGRVARAIPVASAGVILAFGAILVVRATGQF